jgi:hypothetical protein
MRVPALIVSTILAALWLADRVLSMTSWLFWTSEAAGWSLPPWPNHTDAVALLSWPAGRA